MPSVTGAKDETLFITLLLGFETSAFLQVYESLFIQVKRGKITAQASRQERAGRLKTQDHKALRLLSPTVLMFWRRAHCALKHVSRDDFRARLVVPERSYITALAVFIAFSCLQYVRDFPTFYSPR